VEAAGRPLQGRTIVVTRATDQASALVDQLVDLGAEVLAIPVIEIVDASDGGAALADAVGRAADYDWIVVTSVNGVERVVAAADGGAAALASLDGRFAAIGRGTADALERHGLEVGLVPERFVAEGLLEVFPPPPTSGDGRVLLAQAAGARPVLGDGLVAMGWDVDVIEAYRTVHPPIDAELLARAARASAITFTSASTVDGWMQAAGPARLPPLVASIGPVTSAAASAHGVVVDVEASEHSIPGLVAALVDAFGRAS
jgi:uroporphyrinogen-III synthase